MMWSYILYSFFLVKSETVGCPISIYDPKAHSQMLPLLLHGLDSLTFSSHLSMWPFVINV